MKSEYIDLVLVKVGSVPTPIVYAAPPFTYLKEGERVIVEGKPAPEAEGVVVASFTTKEDGDEANFFIKATNAEMPLRRVLKRIWYTELKWKEDEDDSVRID